jgi:hypothetical protein
MAHEWLHHDLGGSCSCEGCSPKSLPEQEDAEINRIARDYLDKLKKEDADAGKPICFKPFYSGPINFTELSKTRRMGLREWDYDTRTQELKALYNLIADSQRLAWVPPPILMSKAEAERIFPGVRLGRRNWLRSYSLTEKVKRLFIRIADRLRGRA